MALRKFNGKKYQIAKRTRRGEVCSKPAIEVSAPVEEVKSAPKKRAKKSTK